VTACLGGGTWVKHRHVSIGGGGGHGNEGGEGGGDGPSLRERDTYIVRAEEGTEFREPVE
jgi:hypothetical protein